MSLEVGTRILFSFEYSYDIDTLGWVHKEAILSCSQRCFFDKLFSLLKVGKVIIFWILWCETVIVGYEQLKHIFILPIFHHFEWSFRINKSILDPNKHKECFITSKLVGYRLESAKRMMDEEFLYDYNVDTCMLVIDILKVGNIQFQMNN